MREYFGEFEVHLTVHATTVAAMDRFRDWCRERKFKCVRIVLSRGDHVEQPMATWRRSRTTLSVVADEAIRFATDAGVLGIPVVRVKVEAARHNEDMPRNDEEGTAHDGRNYFEHHIKLLRDAESPRASLEAVCEQHGAHLSRNAFREPAAGKEERFVTLRSYGGGSDSSELRLRRLLADLETLGEQVVECESEYCVYDSNLDLDAGWLHPPK